MNCLDCVCYITLVKSDFRFDFKTNHPAVTVIFKQCGMAVYDVDLAPVIEVRKWPDTLTRGWQNRSRKGLLRKYQAMNAVIFALQQKEIRILHEHTYLQARRNLIDVGGRGRE